MDAPENTAAEHDSERTSAQSRITASMFGIGRGRLIVAVALFAVLCVAATGLASADATASAPMDDAEQATPPSVGCNEDTAIATTDRMRVRMGTGSNTLIRQLELDGETVIRVGEQGSNFDNINFKFSRGADQTVEGVSGEMIGATLGGTDVCIYRTERDVTVDGSPATVRTTIVVRNGSEVIHTRVSIENEADSPVRYSLPDHFIETGIKVGNLDLSEIDSPFRFYVSGGSVRDFASTDYWETYTPTGDRPFATVFTDEKALTAGLLGGTTGMEMVMTTRAQEGLTFDVGATEVAPGERANWTVVYAVHGGGSGAPDQARTLVSEAPSFPSGPAADAGDSSTVTGGSSVELNASGSVDLSGDALTYSWTQVSGPSVSLSGADTATPTFTAPSVGSPTDLTFEVTVDDGSSTSTDTVTVTVEPSSGGSDIATRSLSGSSVSAGGSLSVTLSAEFDSAHDAVSILDGYSGPISGASIESITVDGEAVADSKVTFSDADEGGITVAVEDVPAGTLEVTYSVSVDASASAGSTLEFTGNADEPDVSAGDVTAEFGTDTATTAESAVAIADTDGDGDIDDGELRAAIVDWSAGRFSDSDLRNIIVEWSS